MLGDAAHPMTPFLGQGACMAIEDALVLGRAFDAANNFEEAFSIYENTRKDRANGVQLASRRQADEIQGVTPRGPNPGKDPVDRGLYSYNPVTVSLARSGHRIRDRTNRRAKPSRARHSGGRRCCP
jgi:salicylate hydroxylase